MFKCLVSSVTLSPESQTNCALLVKVRNIVAFCEEGLQDLWSSSLSVCVGFLYTVVRRVLFSSVNASILFVQVYVEFINFVFVYSSDRIVNVTYPERESFTGPSNLA